VSYLPDLDSAERWVDDWQASIHEKAVQARELSARVSGLRATVEAGTVRCG
jgi:hypothetical protein